jgi:hypothetical protein
MTSRGSASGRFTGAIERRNLLGAEMAARELGHLELADALDLALLFAAKDPVRYQRAAVRWHGRFELEVRGLTIPDSSLLLAALAGLTDIAPRVHLETLAALADRFEATSVARVARRSRA